MVRSAAADAGFPWHCLVGLGCEHVADWVSLQLCLAPTAQMAQQCRLKCCGSACCRCLLQDLSAADCAAASAAACKPSRPNELLSGFMRLRQRLH